MYGYSSPASITTGRGVYNSGTQGTAGTIVGANAAFKFTPAAVKGCHVHPGEQNIPRLGDTYICFIHPAQSRQIRTPQVHRGHEVRPHRATSLGEIGHPLRHGVHRDHPDRSPAAGLDDSILTDLSAFCNEDLLGWRCPRLASQRRLDPASSRRTPTRSARQPGARLRPTRPWTPGTPRQPVAQPRCRTSRGSAITRRSRRRYVGQHSRSPHAGRQLVQHAISLPVGCVTAVSSTSVTARPGPGTPSGASASSPDSAVVKIRTNWSAGSGLKN